MTTKRPIHNWSPWSAQVSPLLAILSHRAVNCLTKIMTAGFVTANTDTRYECLDLLPINWRPANGDQGSECGILLEVWRTGGLVQTSVAMPEGSWVELAIPGGALHGRVTRCEQDDYGFLVSVLVDRNQQGEWFPGYCPLYLRCNDPDS
jgi:hypothetical protein